MQREDPVATRGPYRRTATILVLGNGALIALAVISSLWFFGLHIRLAGFAIALPAMGILTFVTLLTSSTDIRTAVMAAFTVVYLALLGGSLNRDFANAFSTRGSFFHQVYSNLNTFMIAIVGFYFGGKAAEKATENLRMRGARGTVSDRDEPSGSAATIVPPRRRRQRRSARI